MYAELLELARKVGHDAGALLMERPPAFEIESKSTAIDIATQMDKKAEKFIMESLLAARPDDSVVGVVTAPTINSTWWATRGGGAFYNGHQIHCNDPIALDRALIATGFQYDVAHRTTQMTDLAKLVPLARDIRRNGAAAVDLCHVAMGALDGYYEAGLKEWDWAAGGLVATEAGARFVQYGQEPLRTTLAAGPTLHGQLASLLGFTA